MNTELIQTEVECLTKSIRAMCAQLALIAGKPGVDGILDRNRLREAIDVMRVERYDLRCLLFPENQS